MIDDAVMGLKAFRVRFVSRGITKEIDTQFKAQRLTEDDTSHMAFRDQLVLSPQRVKR